jgi:hypothetical protein
VNQNDGFSPDSELKALAEIANIRGEVNERFGKTGNTTTTGITTTTGLVSIPLEKPAKSLYSVYTRLRQRLTREESGGGGTGITWRAITDIFGGGYDAGIAEAATGSEVQFTEQDVTAAYKTLGKLASATFEAQSASETFDDAKAKATLGGLQNLQVSEELSLLGGCTTGVSIPGTLVFADTSTAGSGALTASTAYYFAVSAVTLMGTDWVAGTGSRGHATADSPNETDAVTGTHTTTASGAGNKSVTLSWPAVKGAFAYNVYSGTTSTVHFMAQVTTNAYVQSALTPSSGNVPNSANQTANALQFDGIAVQAALAPSALFYDQANGKLTAGTGSIVEIDTACEDMFKKRLAPTLLLTSGHEAKSIRDGVLSAGTAVSTQRFNTDVGPEGQIRAGSIFMEYTNPFFPGMPIEVMAHPYMPQGTMLLITEKLPPWFPNANIGTTWAVKPRREYYSVEYALATSSGRKWPIGVYVEEVLKGYMPTATAVISGIGA